jgi:hypothetical protein
MRMILLGTVLAASLGVVSRAWSQTDAAVAADAPILLGDAPQLFLDDYVIAKTENLKRQIQSPVRHARNPLIVQDRPWEQRMLSVYGTVLHDESSGRFRCWYLASESDGGIPDTPEAPGTAEYFQCYAESDDGVTWRKPNIAGHPYGRHREHNIVVPRAHGLCVLSTPDDPDPQRRYKALGGNVLGFSPDGLDWSMDTAAAKSWAAAVGKNDTGSCVVRWRGEYLAFVRYQAPERSVRDAAGITWQGVMRAVGLCVSSDFDTWTPKQSVFKADQQDGYPWTQPYGLCVTPYGDVLIGLAPMLHLARETANNSYGTMDVQMVVSRDGRAWRRVADRAAFMEDAAESPEGSEKRRWDAHVYPSTTMFVWNDTAYLYYTGTNLLHGERRKTPSIPVKYGIGLATLPADRFVALRPEPAGAEGMLETRPFRCRAKSLLVNAEVNVRVSPSDQQVEVCDAAGNVLPGFARQDSRLKVRDPLRYEVEWHSSGSAQSLGAAVQSQPAIVLRFYLRGGLLFAFRLA